MKHCCEELVNKLGKGDTYPKPVYISKEDWKQNGHLNWWYPGADGPGYYFIHELDETVNLPTPDGRMITVQAIEFRRMDECPYCGDKKGRPVGRPPVSRPKVSVHISIYPDQVEYLEKIGRGNISKAVRLVTEVHKKNSRP